MNSHPNTNPNMRREPCELSKRKAAFKAFIAREPDLAPEGKKKEAVEKVFFFSDEQFNEICEDLMEEIARRQDNTEPALGFVPTYFHKRNIVREQLSQLEVADMQSLVEDTLLVLMHKHPEGPGDRLECLTKLVEDLQQIVASNTPQASPATLMKSVERTRRAIEQQPDALSKTEVLLEALAESTDELSPSTQELFSMIRQSIAEEKKQPKGPAGLSPELCQAMKTLCNAREREEYTKKMKLHQTIKEDRLRDHAETQTVLDEFLHLAQNLPQQLQNFLIREGGGKDKGEGSGEGSGQPSGQGSAACLDQAVNRVVSAFAEIEFGISQRAGPCQLNHSVSLLFNDIPELIKALQGASYNTKALESLGRPARVASEQDAVGAAKRVYTALLESLP